MRSIYFHLSSFHQPADSFSPVHKFAVQPGLEKKIAALEKQMQWEKLRADALDHTIKNTSG